MGYGSFVAAIRIEDYSVGARRACKASVSLPEYDDVTLNKYRQCRDQTLGVETPGKGQTHRNLQMISDDEPSLASRSLCDIPGARRPNADSMNSPNPS